MKKKPVPQSGFLFKITPEDYITGASPLQWEEVNSVADWTSYIPTEEKQYSYAVFDTFSCTTFSALNAIEIFINWLIANEKMPEATRTRLNELGFYATGSFNASDRFTASMSGTMPNGNYFQNVWDSIRKDGLLPEVLLPFGGKTQLEYLDKKNITEEMKATALEFTKLFDIGYEWVSDVRTLPQQLKQCPVQIAIPKIGSHAVVAITDTQHFDSYEPYIKTNPEIAYGMKVRIAVKPLNQPYQFRTLMKKGIRSEEVRELQKRLREEGFFTWGINTGYFGDVTDRSVRAFQKANGLKDDGVVGPKTHAVLNSLKKKPKVEEPLRVDLIEDLSKWGLTPDTERKARLALAIWKANGYNVRITSGYRSQAEQDKLYAQGRTDKTKPIVTWTRNSNHITGKAFDIAFIGKDPYPKNFDWSVIGKMGESCGLKWGVITKKGERIDLVHFENV